MQVCNTLMAPQLFRRQGDDTRGEASSLDRLHRNGGGAAPQPSSSVGPLFWAVSRLFAEWGALSPRVALLTAAQLSALLDLNPGLLEQYAPLVRRMLLYTSAAKSDSESHRLGSRV